VHTQPAQLCLVKPETHHRKPLCKHRRARSHPAAATPTLMGAAAACMQVPGLLLYDVATNKACDCHNQYDRMTLCVPYSLPLQLCLKLLDILHLPLHHSLPELVIAAEGGLPSQSNTARRHRPGDNTGRQRHVNSKANMPGGMTSCMPLLQHSVIARAMLHCSLQTSIEEVLGPVRWSCVGGPVRWLCLAA